MTKLSSLSPRYWLYVGAFLMLGWLNYAPFWNPDEGRYASSSLEMIGGIEGAQGDWIVPHLNTIPRLNKPPLVYWLAGTFFSIFGTHEWAGRLGSALAAVLVLWLVFRLGRSMFDERTGILAALVWSTCLLPAALGRTLNTDMLLCAAMAIVFYALWFAAQDDRPWSAYLTAGIGFGLGMLAKGPVAVALPLLIGFVFFSAAKKWKNVRWAGVLAAVLIAAAIAAPWFLAIEGRKPGFTYNFIVAENLGRFSGAEDYHDPSPFWFYLPVTLLGLLPWLPLALSMLARSDGDDSQKHARLFLWLWAGIIILFFSKSSTKLFSYILPAYPALALLAAHGILRATTKTRALIMPIVVLTNLLAAVGVTAVLLDNKIIPRDIALPYVFAFVLVLLGSAFLTVSFWRRGEVWKSGLAQFCMAVWLYVCLIAFAGRFAFYEDDSQIYRALRPHIKPGDIVAQVSSFRPTGIYYLARPVLLPNFRNSSGLETKALQASPLFPVSQPNDLSWLLDRPERVLVSIRWRRKDYSVPEGTFTWARNNDFKIISNRPAPPDFRYDFTAPQKAALDTDPRFGPPPSS